MINRELARLKVFQLIYAYGRSGGKPMDAADKELEFSLEKTHELYLYLLNFLVDVHDYAVRKFESLSAISKRNGEDSGDAERARLLAENRFLLQLSENETLAAYREKKEDWDEEPALRKRFYEEFVGSDIFAAYQESAQFDYDADRELVRKLYRTLVEGDEGLDEALEEHNLYWNDDRWVVDSFVVKTVKRFNPENGAEQALLPTFENADEKQFAFDLLHQTLEHEEELVDLIRRNCKNWDFERLAVVDVTIMEMALAEMLYMPGVPVVVSMSVYIDLAKVYSTPQSSGYINGLLDHLVDLLRKDGKLLK